ncbi:hypothetical protein U1Q18_007468 [Sarracenia purpurea var. burkii]
MDSEVPSAPMVDKISQLAESSTNGSLPSKKKQGKVPKRIHKSEREKLKREQLNELFLALANVIGLPHQNSGKASVLGETTRLLKEVHSQIDSLKIENAALLSEFQYVTIENNEIHDENSALEAQIEKLRTEIKETAVLSKPDLNVPPPDESTSHFSVEPLLQQGSCINPVYVIPVCSAYLEQDNTQLAPKPMISNVSKPHARYPTASDSWPSKLLGK